MAREQRRKLSSSSRVACAEMAHCGIPHCGIRGDFGGGGGGWRRSTELLCAGLGIRGDLGGGGGGWRRSTELLCTGLSERQRLRGPGFSGEMCRNVRFTDNMLRLRDNSVAMRLRAETLRTNIKLYIVIFTFTLKV